MQARFDSSKALYQFHFQELYMNISGWDSMFYSLNNTLQRYGAAMLQQDLAMNIIFWTSWVGFYYSGESVQIFNMFSDVGMVFDRQYVHAVISSVESDCNASSASFYDTGSYELSLTYSYSEFIANPRCSGTIDPVLLGYNPVFDGDEFTLNMDVRALVTALGINTGILSAESLRPVFGSFTPYNYSNITYLVGNYYNIRYPGEHTVCVRLLCCAMLGDGMGS